MQLESAPPPPRDDDYHDPPFIESACSYRTVASEMVVQQPSARRPLHASALNLPAPEGTAFQAAKLCDACGAVERHDVKSVGVSQ
jgi:hypothetical protein